MPPVDGGTQAQFRSDWETYGLTWEVLDLIPGEACGFIPRDEDSLLVKTKHHLWTLWFYRGHEANLAFQCQLMQIAAQNGFQGFLQPVLWRDERIYRRLDERNWLYLTQSPALGKIHFHNPLELRGLIGLIGDFRRFTHQCGFYYNCIEQPGIRRKLVSALQYLQIFKMLAEHRIRPTRLDHLLLECFQQVWREAYRALEELDTSAYRRLNAETTHRDRILYNFARPNLGIAPGGQVVLLRLEKCRREIPVIDLGICLVRAGRANGWDLEWSRAMLGEYQKNFPIAAAEITILGALLRFPWSLYRLCSRYYFNRGAWPIPQIVEKMERLLADEPLRQQFTGRFTELMMDEKRGNRVKTANWRLVKK